MELISQGAEAKIYLDNEEIIKERIPKKYRIPKIDEKLRKLRTRKEGKLLEKSLGVSPKVISVDDKEMKIVMEHIKGKVVRDVLSSMEKPERAKLCKEIGKNIGWLHDKEIIHGDLTTSNMIFSDDAKVYFIDFGLGFVSLREEDKAVDLYLFRQVLESYHSEIFEEVFQNVLEGYKSSKDYSKIIERLKKVESRGRYKNKSI